MKGAWPGSSSLAGTRGRIIDLVRRSAISATDIATQLDLAIQQLGWTQPHTKEKFKLRWERRMDRAHKRHLAAVTTLAEFRDLEYYERAN